MARFSHCTPFFLVVPCTTDQCDCMALDHFGLGWRLKCPEIAPESFLYALHFDLNRGSMKNEEISARVLSKACEAPMIDDVVRW